AVCGSEIAIFGSEIVICDSEIAICDSEIAICDSEIAICTTNHAFLRATRRFLPKLVDSNLAESLWLRLRRAVSLWCNAFPSAYNRPAMIDFAIVASCMFDVPS